MIVYFLKNYEKMIFIYGQKTVPIYIKMFVGKDRFDTFTPLLLPCIKHGV